MRSNSLAGGASIAGRPRILSSITLTVPRSGSPSATSWRRRRPGSTTNSQSACCAAGRVTLSGLASSSGGRPVTFTARLPATDTDPVVAMSAVERGPNTGSPDGSGAGLPSTNTGRRVATRRVVDAPSAAPPILSGAGSTSCVRLAAKTPAFQAGDRRFKSDTQCPSRVGVDGEHTCLSSRRSRDRSPYAVPRNSALARESFVVARPAPT